MSLKPLTPATTISTVSPKIRSGCCLPPLNNPQAAGRGKTRYSELCSLGQNASEDKGVESIEEKLIASLAAKFGTNPELEDGLAYAGVDSVGMAELTVEIEQAFGITVNDDIFQVDTVQELADFIRERQKVNSG